MGIGVSVQSVLSAGQLGMYAATQIPAGVLLDRFGSQRYSGRMGTRPRHRLLSAAMAVGGAGALILGLQADQQPRADRVPVRRTGTGRPRVIGCGQLRITHTN